MPVPRDRSAEEMTAGIPVTYVPAQHRLPGARPGLGRDARRLRSVYRSQRGRLLRISRLPARVRPLFRAAGQPGHQGRRRGQGPIPRPRAAHPSFQGGNHPARQRPRRRLRPDAQLLRPGPGRRRLRPLRLLPHPPRRLRRGRRPRPHALRRLINPPRNTRNTRKKTNAIACLLSVCSVCSVVYFLTNGNRPPAGPAWRRSRRG